MLSNRTRCVTKFVTLLAIAGALPAGMAASAAEPSTTREQTAGEHLAEGWKRTLPIPLADLGEGDRYVIWVEGGWLQAKREKADGATDWHIVLARADDSTPPKISAPTGSIHFEASYENGRYFIREDAFSLRSVRQRKGLGDIDWPTIDVPTDDKSVLKTSAGSADRPPALREVQQGDWIVVTSGPSDKKIDCLIRLCPNDASLTATGGNWGSVVSHGRFLQRVPLDG